MRFRFSFLLLACVYDGNAMEFICNIPVREAHSKIALFSKQYTTTSAYLFNSVAYEHSISTPRGC